MSRLIQEDRLRRSNLSAGKRIPYRHHRLVSLSRSSPLSIANIVVQTQFHVTRAQRFFIISRSRNCFPVESARFSRCTRFCYRGVTLRSKVSNKERSGCRAREDLLGKSASSYKIFECTYVHTPWYESRFFNKSKSLCIFPSPREIKSCRYYINLTFCLIKTNFMSS